LNSRVKLGLLAAAVTVAFVAAPATAPAAKSKANWTLDGKPCKLIPVPAAAPVGTGTCPGVRPGAIVNSETGQCTFNFLFNGSDGRRYIGTAGHCILGESPIGGDVGEESWAPGTGPEATDAAGNRIGEFAYAILQDPKDFAVIRLDPGVEASPQMCHFGGPTGVNSDQGSAPVVLQYFGNGLGVGSVLPARSALALGMPDPDHVFANGVVIPGDSGSGVISSDGRAVGVAVTLGVHTGSIGTGGIDVGTIGITRLAPQEARAEQVLGHSLTLQTAGLL
jgi:Trypsin-like peptidase domain